MGKILMKLRGDMAREEILMQDSKPESRDEQTGEKETVESSDVMMDTGENSSMEFLDTSVKSGDSEEKNLGVAVVLGDSNIRNCDIENVPLNVINAAKGGTAVQGIADQLQQVHEDPKKVKVVLLHVGTCNWGSGDLVRADNVYLEYVEALNAVSICFPETEMVISSVPPRIKGVGCIATDEINGEIRVLNEMLEKLANGEENMLFINNDMGLTVDGKPYVDVYRSNDISGVHLNKMGLSILTDNVQQGIREAYYKARLRDEWNVRVVPKISS